MTQTLVYPTAGARWGQARAQLMNRSALHVLFFQIIANMESIGNNKRAPFQRLHYHFSTMDYQKVKLKSHVVLYILHV